MKNANDLLTIVVPTYNEVDNIPVLLSRIEKSLKGFLYEIIIVDDNSPDGTGKKADELAKKYPLTVVHRKNERGLSSAVLNGFKLAKGNILCCLDADLSHPPETIPELLKPIKKEKMDLVFASRLVEGGGVVGSWPQHRKFTSYVATLIAKPLCTIKDSMSGFFVLRSEVIENVDLVPRGYKIGLEILVRGNYKNVKEVPFVFDNRQTGVSKLNLKVQADYLIQIVNLIFYRIKKLIQHQCAMLYRAFSFTDSK